MGEIISSPILTIHPSLLTVEECRALKSLSDTIGFVYSPIIGSPKLPRGFTLQNGRDNDRTAIEDRNLTDALWSRIKHLVPCELEGKAVI